MSLVALLIGGACALTATDSSADDVAEKRSGVDWEARYVQYLEDNPKVKAAVQAGRIAKSAVIAGIKSRYQEAGRQKWEVRSSRVKIPVGWEPFA